MSVNFVIDMIFSFIAMMASNSTDSREDVLAFLSFVAADSNMNWLAHGDREAFNPETCVFSTGSLQWRAHDHLSSVSIDWAS